MLRRMAFSIVVLLGAALAGGQVTVPGADGSDGVFNPTSNMTIDLSQAATATWDTASPAAGKGVYDPAKWAVVFKYASVNIPSNVTVTFTNHPSGAPVVWLVSGSATIAGTVSLNGNNYSGASLSLPGPGGFHGGRATVNSAISSNGFGPGGGIYNGYEGSGGSYGSVGASNNSNSIYGNISILPLIGGSGGSGRLYNDYYNGAGAGGGGAILIAVQNNINFNGIIQANGGNGYNAGSGSGGAIRLIGDQIVGSGGISAVGGWGNVAGGNGRIRFEANNVNLSSQGSPAAVVGSPGTVAKIWPEAAAPKIKATLIGGLAVPADPKPNRIPMYDVQISNPSPVLRIEAENVPTNWVVKVRIVPLSGTAITVNATLVSGNQTASIWEAQIAAMPNSLSAVQVRASAP